MKVLLAILTFPFWLLAALVSLVGRILLAALAIALMACGTALWLHSTYVAVGIAIFVAGLVLFVRAVV